eukprot:COSAG01_NODE_26103_length_723_cov_1.588141_1_plen_111_part_01
MRLSLHDFQELAVRRYGIELAAPVLRREYLQLLAQVQRARGLNRQTIDFEDFFGWVADMRQRSPRACRSLSPSQRRIAREVEARLPLPAAAARRGGAPSRKRGTTRPLAGD